jgi:hypothetical protein
MGFPFLPSLIQSRLGLCLQWLSPRALIAVTRSVRFPGAPVKAPSVSSYFGNLQCLGDVVSIPVDCCTQLPAIWMDPQETQAQL